MRTRASFMDKQKGIVQQVDLRTGLDLPGGRHTFVIFRDALSGLQYIRNCGEVARQGLYVQLDAYRAHVFLDFQIVEEDEKDTGERMLLNFGHTIAHALETYTHYSKYSHGEAVAIGMVAITRLSEKKGFTKPGTAAAIKALAKQVGLPTELNIGEFDLDSLLAIMTLDKKNLDNHLKVILLKEIGNSYVQNETIAFFDGLENM